MQESAPTQETKPDLMTKLAQDGVTIEWPRPRHFGEVSQRIFPELTDREILENAVRYCREFLDGIIIKDRFGSDVWARHDWYKKMEAEYGREFTDLYDRSKMRATPQGRVYMILQGLDLELHKSTSPEAQELHGLVLTLPSKEDFLDYHHESDENKRVMVAKLESAAERFLKLVSVPEQAAAA